MVGKNPSANLATTEESRYSCKPSRSSKVVSKA